MFNLSQSKIKYGNLIVAIMFNIAALIISFYFLNIKIQLASQRLMNKRNELMALENKEKLTQDLFLEKKELEEEIRLIKNVLPDEDNLVNFVQTIEHLVNENKLEYSLKLIEKPSAELKKEKEVLVCDLYLKGKESSIFAFLEALNQTSYFINIYNFEEDISNPEVASANIKLGVFTNAEF